VSVIRKRIQYTNFDLTLHGHCSANTEGGRRLCDLVKILWKVDDVTDDDVETIIDTIHSRVCSPEEIAKLLELSPRAVVLRNVLKPILGMYLAKNHARQLGVRFTCWRARDYGEYEGASKALTAEVMDVLGALDSSLTGKLDTWLCFFVGCHYITTTNDLPELGWFNNGTCIGVKLLLDHREPPDNPETPFRRLLYTPLAVIVRPSLVDIGDILVDENVPSGCFPVIPVNTSFTVSSLALLHDNVSHSFKYLHRR